MSDPLSGPVSDPVSDSAGDPVSDPAGDPLSDAANARCIICHIVAGSAPAEVVYQGGGITAFRDIRPQAPTHVLVVPNRHIESLWSLDDPALAGELLLACRPVAAQLGLDDGYRVVLNVGEHAGREPHLHLHVLGGRPMGWPPG